MSALRSQISWLLNGQANTTAALASLGDHLRASQDKVARLEGELDHLRAARAAEAAEAAEVARLGAEVEAMKGQLRAAVDDLADRVGLLSNRLG